MARSMIHVGVLVALCTVASSAGVARKPPGSGDEPSAGVLLAARPAEIPAAAWERVLETIAGHGYAVRPAGHGAEGTSGAALSARSFTEEAIVRASDAQASDEFGFSVAISGDTAIVGASSEDGGAGDPLPDAGAAYVFRESFLRFFIADLRSEPSGGRPLTLPR